MLAAAQLEKEKRDPVYYIERNFYVEDTGKPLVLFRHQKAVLRYALQRNREGHLLFRTAIYSCPKKSGKTAVAAAVAQWASERWGKFGEIACVGNDLKQAKERAFAAIKRSIEMMPGYDKRRQSVPGHWRWMEHELINYESGTHIKAVASDFKGEAGGNPTLTVWTELWGFTDAAALKFWAEMAPSPTRPDSMRWIETYAGFEGESDLLFNLYESTVKNGRQLTLGELIMGDESLIGCFEESPNLEDPVPCYVNEAAGTFAYWDDGEKARRMPWQKGERGRQYYANEATNLSITPSQMARLHSNLWGSSESQFVEMAWFDACRNPLPLRPGEKTQLIIGLDAAVSGDSFAAAVGSRDPDNPKEGVAMRDSRVWYPPKGGKIDYGEVKTWLRRMCKDYNIMCVVYDPYQLHDLATEGMREGLTWFRDFNQGVERLTADGQFYRLIVKRNFRHNGDSELRDHIANANKKQSPHEDTKMRIIKKTELKKIDLAVASSMMSYEVLRLNLE